MEVIVLSVPNSELFSEVIEGIEFMGRVKILIINVDAFV